MRLLFPRLTDTPSTSQIQPDLISTTKSENEQRPQPSRRQETDCTGAKESCVASQTQGGWEFGGLVSGIENFEWVNIPLNQCEPS